MLASQPAVTGFRRDAGALGLSQYGAWDGSRRTLQASVLGAALGLAGSAGWAQDVSTEIGLYGFAVAIGGDAALGPVDLDIDLSVRDVLDALEGAFLGFVEHRRNDWLFVFRVEYMDLSFDAEVTRGPLSVSTAADMAQLTPQAFVGYRFQDVRTDRNRLTADIFAGLRRIDIDLDVEASLAGLGPGVDRGFEREIAFTDPVIASRTSYRWDDRWGVSGWIDVGGFGLGSEYSITAELTVDRRWDNGWRVFGGYKFFTFEYEDSRDVGDLTFTPTYQGPLLGASYRF